MQRWRIRLLAGVIVLAFFSLFAPIYLLVFAPAQPKADLAPLGFNAVAADQTKELAASLAEQAKAVIAKKPNRKVKAALTKLTQALQSGDNGKIQQAKDELQQALNNGSGNSSGSGNGSGGAGSGSGSSSGGSSGGGGNSGGSGSNSGGAGSQYGSGYSYSRPFQGSACTNSNNETRINTEIRAALSQGKDAYLIPAGTCPIGGAINFPDGTSNFAIVGAGSGQTIFTTPSTKLNNAFELGFPHFSHNNWGLTDRPSTPVENVAKGATTVTLRSGTVEPGWYVLWDNYGVVNRYGSYPIFNRGEIVEVKSYDTTTKKATLDIAIGRDYNLEPKLTSMSNRLSRNITLKGIGFDGTAPNGEFSTGLGYLSLIQGLTVEDVEAKKFLGPALQVVLSRNIDVKGVKMSENAGSYGLMITKSHWANVHDSIAAPSVSTAFVGHTGAMKVWFHNLTAPRVDGSHGYDEQDILIESVTGNLAMPDYPGELLWDATCGNLAWMDGVDGCTIKNSQSIHEVFSGPRSRNVVAENIKARVLRINEENGVGPVTTLIKNSELAKKGPFCVAINLSWFGDNAHIGQVTLDNVKVTNTANCNYLLKGKHYIGELIIKNSNFVDVGRGYELIDLETNHGQSKLSVTNTTFSSLVGDTAMYLRNFQNPCVEVRNNTYNVQGNNPTKFENTNICP